MVRIPELELELMEGTLGGKFTTIEGLLTNIVDQVFVPFNHIGEIIRVSAVSTLRMRLCTTCFSD